VRQLLIAPGVAPRERGRVHGESFRGEIRTLAELRIHLCCTVGRFTGADQVLAVARRHLPVLERFDAGLAAELAGIADGAGLSAEHIVVLNHYTDLRDLEPDAGEGDGCSVIWAETASGRILAQTWDMHATALPYVMMLGVEDSWLLTVTGCLGLAGMHRQRRVAVAINNLHSNDAGVGVVWPALVRKAVAADSAAAARDLIMGAPVGSGHHYLVADRRDAFGIETSGVLRRLHYAGQPPVYLHTNHCLDGDVAAVSRVPPASTTHDRYVWLRRSLDAEPLRDLDDAWRRLGSTDGYPRSVCTNMATPANPHASATCGAIAMNLDSGEIRAQAGLIHNVAGEVFR